MKQLAILLLFLLLIGAVIGIRFAIDYLADSDPRTPPPDQVAESVDAPPEGERSGKWTTVRNRFVEDHPVCEACGGDDDLNVHHIMPFHESPELELEASNLITLCRDHHFDIGHDPDGPEGPRTPNWKLSNPHVRSDARKHFLSLAP